MKIKKKELKVELIPVYIPKNEFDEKKKRSKISSQKS